MGDRSEDFYHSTAGYDYYRLPLIRPYYASNPMSDTWFLMFPKEQNPAIKDQIGARILKINVSNNYIFGYCEGASYRYQDGSTRNDTVYLIISPNQEDSTFYSLDKTQYLKKLVERKLRWYPISDK